MKNLVCVLICTIILFTNTYANQLNIPPEYKQVKHELRAAWIASVANINWPSEKGLSAEQQKNEYVSLVERIKNLKLNAVIVQVRPTSDAFYKSELNPWSEYLTGTQGKDPGYDPLHFMIEETHKRSLEFHAWFNPFRISNGTDMSGFAPNNVALKNPGWVLKYGGKLYINPGIPEAREYVVNSVMEVVKNYDIDAVHFDDYFYPYPDGKKEIPDKETFNKYNRGFKNIEDWRRDNVNLVIKELSEKIAAEKNYVKFGISPFAIWRNKSSDPTGSDTNGMSSYEAVYADSRAWIKNGWIDYIMPQIYWEFGNKAAAYEKVLSFWAEEIKQNPNVHLYIGQGAYKMGTTEAWKNPYELPNQLKYNQNFGEVKGSAFYNIHSVLNNNDFLYALPNQLYKNEAVVPVMPWKTPDDAKDLTPPVLTGHNMSLTITAGNENTAYYIIYRSEGDAVIDISNPQYIYKKAAYTNPIQVFTDTNVAAGKNYNYIVTSVDRLHNESVPSNRIQLSVR